MLTLGVLSMATLLGVNRDLRTAAEHLLGARGDAADPTLDLSRSAGRDAAAGISRDVEVPGTVGRDTAPAVSGRIIHWGFDEVSGATIDDDVGVYDLTAFGGAAIVEVLTIDGERVRRFNNDNLDSAPQLYGGYAYRAGDATLRSKLRGENLSLKLKVRIAGGGYQSNNPILYVGSGDPSHVDDSDAMLLLVYSQVESIGVSWTSSSGVAENFFVPFDFPDDDQAFFVDVLIHIVMASAGAGFRAVSIYIDGALYGTSGALPVPESTIGTAADIYLCREEPSNDNNPTPPGTTDQKDPGWGAAIFYDVEIWDKALSSTEVATSTTTTDLPAESTPSTELCVPIEPYIVARVDFGDGDTRWWGELDREVLSTPETVPSAPAQILAELMSVGQIERSFTPDRALGQVRLRVVIRNEKGDKNQLLRGLDSLRNPSLLRARWRFYLGYDSVGFSAARRLTPQLIVARVGRISREVIELELEDAAAEDLGRVRMVPTLQLIYDGIVGGFAAPYSSSPALLPGLEMTSEGLELDDAVRGTRPQIALGAAWVRPTPMRDSGPTFTSLVWLLALARRPWQTRRHPLGGVPEEIPWGFMRSDASGARRLRPTQMGPSGSPVSLEPSIYIAPFVVDGVPWYAAILYLQVQPNAGAPGGGYAVGSNEDLRWMQDHPSEWWVQPPVSDRVSAPELLEDVVNLYSEASGSSVLPPIDFLDTRPGGTVREAQEALAGTVAGGVIESGQRVSDVVSAICASWGIDPFFDARGILKLRPAGATTKDLAERIPEARAWGDIHDVAMGSWGESIPVANERWGCANRFKTKGAPDWTPSAWADHLQLDQYVRLYGRIIEKDIEVSWSPRELEGSSSLERGDTADHVNPRHVASFRLPLSGAELELGDWVRLTHYSGFDETTTDGYEERLARVERVSLDWRAAQVEVAALDMGELEDSRPWVLDDEDLWLRYEPFDSTERLSLTSGSAFVTLIGWNAEDEGVQDNDQLWLAAGDYGTDGWIARIVDVQPGGGVIEVEGAQDQPLKAPSTSASYTGAWAVLRSYTTAPNNTSNPGKYVGLASARDLYGSLCDEEGQATGDPTPTDTDEAWRAGELGAFANSDKGYSLYTE